MSVNVKANTDTDPSGSTKARGGGKTALIGAGETAAAANAAAPSASSKRARKPKDNGALPTAARDSKEAAKAAAGQDAATRRERPEQSRRASNGSRADSERERSRVEPGWVWAGLGRASAYAFLMFAPLMLSFYVGHRLLVLGTERAHWCDKIRVNLTAPYSLRRSTVSAGPVQVLILAKPGWGWKCDAFAYGCCVF